jgi:hypothetical protein
MHRLQAVAHVGERPGDDHAHRVIEEARAHLLLELATLDAAGAERLPEPSKNPGEIDVGPDDIVPDELHDKLRRAWDRISGKS